MANHPVPLRSGSVRSLRDLSSSEPVVRFADKGGHDEHAADELHTYIHNDSHLYHSQHVPIIKNLMHKKARGIYDSGKAHKLFGYLADNGAQKYHKEHGDTSKPWHHTFTPSTRHEVARRLRDDFEGEAKLGNYDHHVPKKYAGKPIQHSDADDAELVARLAEGDAARFGSGLKWRTFAGGTGAAEGKHGHATYTEHGEYHISPFTTKSGAHAGYSLKFAHTKGTGKGLSGGLWHDLGTHRSPNEAKSAAVAHHQKISGPAAHSSDPAAMFSDFDPNKLTKAHDDAHSALHENGYKYSHRVGDIAHYKHPSGAKAWHDVVGGTTHVRHWGVTNTVGRKDSGRKRISDFVKALHGHDSTLDKQRHSSDPAAKFDDHRSVAEINSDAHAVLTSHGYKRVHALGGAVYYKHPSGSEASHDTIGGDTYVRHNGRGYKVGRGYNEDTKDVMSKRIKAIHGGTYTEPIGLATHSSDPTAKFGDRSPLSGHFDHMTFAMHARQHSYHHAMIRHHQDHQHSPEPGWKADDHAKAAIYHETMKAAHGEEMHAVTNEQVANESKNDEDRAWHNAKAAEHHSRAVEYLSKAKTAPKQYVGAKGHGVLHPALGNTKE